MIPIVAAPRLLSLVQAAALLSVSKQTVWNMIRDGRLLATKVANCWVVEGVEIDRILAARALKMSPAELRVATREVAACRS